MHWKYTLNVNVCVCDIVNIKDIDKTSCYGIHFNLFTQIDLTKFKLSIKILYIKIFKKYVYIKI